MLNAKHIRVLKNLTYADLSPKIVNTPQNQIRMPKLADSRIYAFSESRVLRAAVDVIKLFWRKSRFPQN